MMKVIAFLTISLLYPFCFTGSSIAYDSVSNLTESVQKIVFNEDNAYKQLKNLCDFGPRCMKCPGHEKAVTYFKRKFDEYADETKLQHFEYYHKWDRKSYQLTNAIGFFDSKSDKKIILGTHFDTRPFSDEDPNPDNFSKPVIGADDGGSGCAVLLELARLLSIRKADIDVEIVMFDGHETVPKGSDDYFLGSKFYVDGLKDKDDILMYLNVNMVGHSGLKFYIERSSLSSAKEYVEYLWKKGNVIADDTFINKVKYRITDDHTAFLKHGIPAVDIIDFDNWRRHTQHDTLDTISKSSLKVVGDVVADFVYNYDWKNNL